jgi:hypothetical protein
MQGTHQATHLEATMATKLCHPERAAPPSKGCHVGHSRHGSGRQVAGPHQTLDLHHGPARCNSRHAVPAQATRMLAHTRCWAAVPCHPCMRAVPRLQPAP